MILVANISIPSDYQTKFAPSVQTIRNEVLEKGCKMVHNKKYHPHIKGKMGFAKVLVQKT
jgi:uncharacterized Zn-finger protein